MIRTFTLALALMVVCTTSSRIFAQQAKESHGDETVAQVPVLTDFHEVIFKVWHTAWPEKNLAMLAGLLPEIKQFSDTLAKVKLPGILRDKQMVWKQNTAKLQEIVSSYAGASSPIDSVKLLEAAEKLHMQYEALVRITRPVLKEMDAFHQVLYVLYHHFLPDKNLEKLASSVRELKASMAVLEKAVLPDRFKKRENSFNEARAMLVHSVAMLDEEMAKDNLKEFASRVETMHTDYQTLEKVFE